MDPVVSKEKTISTGLPLPPVTAAAPRRCGVESLAGGDSILTFFAGDGFDFTVSSSSASADIIAPKCKGFPLSDYSIYLVLLVLYVSLPPSS